MIGNKHRPDGGVDCPGCGKVFDTTALKDRHASADYFDGSEFNTRCDWRCDCGEVIEVYVEAVPEFSRAYRDGEDRGR